MTVMDRQETPPSGEAATLEKFGIKPKRADRRRRAACGRQPLHQPDPPAQAGAAGGLLATLIIFALLPGATNLYSLQGSMTFLTLSAELGIIATAAALLIIAGEFDLSVGSMIGFAGVRHRPDRQASRPAAVGRHRLRLRGCGAGRFLNGLIVVEDEDAFLHRDLGLAVHPARPVHRHHARRHRAHPDPLHPPGRAGPRQRQPFQRPSFPGLFPLDGPAGMDRHPQRRHSVRHRNSDVESPGGSCSPSWLAMC